MKNRNFLPVLATSVLLLTALAVSGQTAAESGYTASNAPRKVEIREQDRQRAAELVSRMTLSEKIAYISGLRSFYIRAVERLGIPEIRMADGPQGVRNNTRSTLYPCGMMTAATWNRDLALELGRSLARDCRARGVDILLGPGVNICRSPLCGRNFEYFGEDPYLTSETAVGYILGLQERGVMATIKHFALNNQEWSRHNASSDADERTMQEIYFPAFRKAVQQAGVGSVMDSYNLIWGVHASENRWLNVDVLRRQWGFEGIVMSDWTSTYSTAGIVRGGLDLEMPKGWYFNEEGILPLLESGVIHERDLDEKVCHILQTLSAFGFLDRQSRPTKVGEDDPASVQTALDIAREGIVLLKNDGDLLPLGTNGRTKGAKGRILVLGPNAEEVPHGGGSGSVTPFGTVSVYEGLKQTLGEKNVELLSEERLYASIDAAVRPDSLSACTGAGESGYRADYYLGLKPEGDVLHTRIEPTVEGSWGYGAPFEDMPDDGYSVSWEGFYKAPEQGLLRAVLSGDDGYRLFVNGRQIGGDWGRHALSSRTVFLPVEKDSLYHFRFEFFEAAGEARARLQLGLRRDDVLRDAARRASAIVYCGGFNADLEGEGFDRPFELPGSQTADLELLTGLNPRTVMVLHAGSAVDFRGWGDRVPAILMAWYPGQEGGRAVAEVLTGRVCPSGKLPVSMEQRWEDNPVFDSYYDRSKAVHKRVTYTEGVFVGYRGYDRNGVAPRYPFGYGLSYTTFSYSNLTVEPLGGSRVRVAFDVANTGKVDGREVAQVYVSDCEASVPRPEKELKHYAKVEIPRGKSVHVELELTDEAFGYYDVEAGKFVVEPGDFVISVGGNSADRPLRATVTLR